MKMASVGFSLLGSVFAFSSDLALASQASSLVGALARVSDSLC